MKTYTCPLTKFTLEYPESGMLKVYVRRFNCPKKLVRVTDNPDEAIRAYLGIKIFKNDKAYIFSNDQRLVFRCGEGEKPYSLRGMKRPLNYKRRVFSTPNMPETVHNALLALENVSLDGETCLSMARGIILVASKLASMDKQDQIDFLRACVPDYHNHLKLSGCDNAEFLDEKSDEDLL